MDPLPLRAIAAYFTWLGLTGFGGPLAHITMMEEFTVRRRRWVSSQQFSEALALCQLLPGPVSTQLAIHIGYLRGGFTGAVAAGTGFILPAYFMMVGLSALYWRYGSLPAVNALFYGLNPAVIALIAIAALRLGRVSARGWATASCVVAAFAARTLFGMDEVLILLGLGALGAISPSWFSSEPDAEPGEDLRGGQTPPAQGGTPMPSDKGSLPPLPAIAVGTAASSSPVSYSAAAGTAGTGVASGALLIVLAVFFLKVGAFVFGGGYVIVPLMESYVVDQASWMSRSQFLDGIALGQVTPGPILITAAFVGYSAAGAAGSAVGTAAIFLPSFAWILACSPHLPRLRRRRRTRAFLAAANPAAVGTIAAAAWSLGRSCIVDSPTVVIATAVLALSLCGRVAPYLLVLGASVAGLILA